MHMVCRYADRQAEIAILSVGLQLSEGPPRNLVYVALLLQAHATVETATHNAVRARRLFNDYSL